jgi:hypothetical protein
LAPSANVVFVYHTLVPMMMPNIRFLAVIDRAINTAIATPYLNRAMALDWIHALLEGLLRPPTPQLEIDAIACAAESVTNGQRFSLALIPFLSAILDDFALSRLADAGWVAARVLDYLVFVFCLGKTTPEFSVPPALLRLIPSEQIEKRVSRLLRPNALSEVSFLTFKKLFGAPCLPPVAFELALSHLYLDHLVASDAVNIELSELFTSLIIHLEERSPQFFQVLEMLPTFYHTITARYPDFFNLLLHRIGDFLFTEKCSVHQFRALVDVVTQIMIESERGQVFTKCLGLITREDRHPERESILHHAVCVLIANYQRSIPELPPPSDVTFYVLVDHGPLFGVVLKEHHFCVHVAQPVGTSAYRLRPISESTAVLEPPADLDESIHRSIFAHFAASPSSAFLFGLTADVLHRETKIVAQSDDLRLKFGRQSRRLACVVGIVFIGANSPANILTTAWSDTSSQFREFLSSLGEPRVLAHPRDGLHAPLIYWQGFLYSATFRIAPLFIEAGAPPETVSRSFLELPVLIVWLERGECSRTISDRTAVHIIIQPAENPQCLRISVHKPEQLKFALIDTNLTVPKAVAGLIVRWTAIFASAAVRAVHGTRGADKRHAGQKGAWQSFPPTALFSFGLP